MVFSSSLFLFLFLPLTLTFYYIFKCSNKWLLIMSFLFYAWGEPKNIFLMLLIIFINYALGIWIDRNRRKAKSILIFGLIIDFLSLFLFKYLNFVTENLFSIGILHSITSIALPIGISFYVFQASSYLIDLYRGTIKVQKNLMDLALYISMFPQLIAGPIVRYSVIENEIHHRSITYEDITMGIERFAIGIIKKVLIADKVALVADSVFAQSNRSIVVSWIGAIAYTMQIYYDFSGYSDMAIGLGRLLGFHFSENFDYPYVSSSVKEFWRRWHISLSTWFRDYVYIPLGGSRCSRVRSNFNLFIVFFLTGVWHGANWTFFAWGIYYAFILIIERFFNSKLEKIPKLIRHIFTMIIVTLGWVIFRSDSIGDAVIFIFNMFHGTISSTSEVYYCFTNEVIFAFILAFVFLRPKAFEMVKKNDGFRMLKKLVLTIAFVYSAITILCNDFSPFLYFRF